MKKLEVGDALPDINITTTNAKVKNLADFKGENLVIYFYPKDNTPGCTIESKAFRDNFKKFQSLKTQIIGVSRDSLASHEKFKCKHDFPFELISDSESQLCELFGVIKAKKLFGKTFKSIERSTFIFNHKGELCHAIRGVKVSKHVEDVLEKVRQLN